MSFEKLLRERWFPPALLCAVVFIIYFLSLFNGFVFDDIEQVLNNVWVTDVRYIPEVLFSGAWEFKEGHGATNYYRPMMHLAFMLEYHLFGAEIPGLWHFFNIVLHAINVLVAYSLFRLLLKDFEVPAKNPQRGFSRESIALMAALLYAVHPMASEVVMWVSAVPELSLAFFYLLSFSFYIRFTRGGSKAAYIASLALFFLAALSKETAMTLPLVIVAYDLIKRERKPGRAIIGYIPFAIMALLYIVIRERALHFLVPVGIAHPYLTGYENVINMFPLLAGYFKALLIPIKLNPFHLLDPIFSLGGARAIVSLVVTAAIPVLFYIFRREKLLLVTFTLILFPLFTVLYIPLLGDNAFSERYLYLSITGYALLLALFLNYLSVRGATALKPVLLAFIAITLFYSAVVAKHNPDWKSNQTLWEGTLRIDPDNSFALYELANIYALSGREDEALDFFIKAREIYGERKAPDLDMMETLTSTIASGYILKGEVKRAIELYEEFIRSYSTSFDFAYRLATLYKIDNHPEKALKLLYALLRDQKDKAERGKLYLDIADIYLAKGQNIEALREYDNALQLEPGDGAALRGRAKAMEMMRE
jgi:tetratricopeptide (TPR) repeat protein